MKILMIAPEAAPFVKVGGVADVVSSLSVALFKLGHDVRIVIPRYYRVNRQNLTKLEGPMGVPCGCREEWTAVYTCDMTGTQGLPVYFIDHEQFYGREGIYGTPAEPDFADNPQRFSLLCHAAFQLCRKLDWYPDILHAHDWPASLACVLLKFNERKNQFAHTASMLTIHNLGYQGVYGKHQYPSLGLDWNHFYSAGFEDWDRMNFLKAGLLSSDVLTTVSAAYAAEIQKSEFGFRMDGILRARSADLCGILNGIDTDVWNPATDPYIAQPYSAKNPSLKVINKKALQRSIGFEINDKIPLIGMITRLVDQKGINEMFAPGFGCLQRLCEMRLQIVVLGAGESWCETELRAASEKLANFRAHIGYDEALSHQIEAGCDFFLMPSRYEPCGLNQMYSLSYGTLPIVRRTGGLADTVANYNEKTGEGTGFCFDDLNPQSIFDTVGWALYAWYNKQTHIEDMRRRAMELKFGWNVSAQKYVKAYEKALEKTTAEPLT